MVGSQSFAEGLLAYIVSLLVIVIACFLFIQMTILAEKTFHSKVSLVFLLVFMSIFLAAPVAIVLLQVTGPWR
jgi:hypothetical protein